MSQGSSDGGIYQYPQFTSHHTILFWQQNWLHTALHCGHVAVPLPGKCLGGCTYYQVKDFVCHKDLQCTDAQFRFSSPPGLHVFRLMPQTQPNHGRTRKPTKKKVQLQEFNLSPSCLKPTLLSTEPLPSINDSFLPIFSSWPRVGLKFDWHMFHAKKHIQCFSLVICLVKVEKSLKQHLDDKNPSPLQPGLMKLFSRCVKQHTCFIYLTERGTLENISHLIKH